MSDKKRMRVGQIPLSDNYRQAVGPEEKYDLIGAHQFCVLVREGLREWHKLLDVGCGSLRGGRLFIPYLGRHNYYGIEPNKDLVIDGLQQCVIHDEYFDESWLYNFSHNDNFELATKSDYLIKNWGEFDFVLAQSIFSHSTQSQSRKCISELPKVLTEDGKFLATFVKGSYNDTNPRWSRPIVYRTTSFFESLAKDNGLMYTELDDIVHPCGQTWFRMEHK